MAVNPAWATDHRRHARSEVLRYALRRDHEIVERSMSKRVKWSLVIGFSVVLSLGALACAPEVGSDAWCKKMKETPKGDWSANEAADYAKHCVLK